MLDIRFRHSYTVDSNIMFIKLSDSSLRLHCLLTNSNHVATPATECLTLLWHDWIRGRRDEGSRPSHCMLFLFEITIVTIEHP